VVAYDLFLERVVGNPTTIPFDTKDVVLSPSRIHPTVEEFSVKGDKR
jgi:hypothetical protein